MELIDLYILSGQTASIGISKTSVDNSDLSRGLIARKDCTVKGSVSVPDPDFILGGDAKSRGYTKSACETTARYGHLTIFPELTFLSLFSGTELGRHRLK